MSDRRDLHKIAADLVDFINKNPTDRGKGKRPGHPQYGITFYKSKAGPGTIAAPPEYAHNTRMYVPGYGWGSVQDTGGAIKGNHLDVWFETVEEARKWGRRKINVIVCKG